jgi:Cd2+/Zn2+-exporting ATPase
MLTGDNPACAKAVAEAVGVDEWHAGMLPQDKVAHVEQFIAEKPKGKTLCFVGDGINDAPVLSVADVGLSMGGIGSDAAIEASDVVIVNDDLSSVLRARRIAVKTMHIVKQNVVFALGVKLAVLILSALGITGMWLAVFADVGVAVIAILNAMRALVDRE